MRVNEYRVMCDAVERGIDYGWNRAHKHDDDPLPETIKHHIEEAILNEICEYFEFVEEVEKEV
jgi:hypothetical protein